MQSRRARQFGELYDAISSDIFKFCRVMRFKPTWQQEQLLLAIQNAKLGKGNHRIAVKSGQGPGKTAASSLAAAWVTLLAPNALTVVTAPTMRQCTDVFLAELRRHLDRADPVMRQIIKVTGTKATFFGRKDWGIKTVTATKPENAQGLHHPSMSIFFEEASGIPAPIVEQFKGTLSNPDCLFVQIGNPNCVLGSTEVYDPSRGRVSVQDLAGRGACRVAAMDEATETIASQSARAFFSGRKQCVNLVVSTGQQLGLSTDHPVYTPEGWVHAGRLEVGDLVAMPRFLPSPERDPGIPDEHLKLVAYMLTDGCCTQAKGTTSRSSFAQMPGPVLDEFCSLVNAIGGRTLIRNTKGRSKSVEASGVQGFLRQYRISGCSAKTKRVPSEFFLLDDRQVGLLLNRMWACDGSFNRYGPKITLCNKRLLDDIQTLLLRLGIHSTIWRTDTRVAEHHRTYSWLKGRQFEAWTLAVTERASQERWMLVVGDVLGKPNRFPLAAGTNPNSDIVPFTNKELLEAFEEMELPSGKRGDRRRSDLAVKWRRVRRMSRESLRGFCEETGYSGRHSRRASNDLRWVVVKSVDAIGEHDVYDLTVPAAGNFVANNLVIHNTRSCPFFDCFNSQRHLWETFTFNAEDTARDYPWIVSPERNKLLEEEFGRDSDVYRVRVLGEFPSADPNCVISSEDLEKVCTGRQADMLRHARASRVRRFGIDLARFGGDESVIVRRSGNAVVDWRFFAHAEPVSVVQQAFRMQAEAVWSDEQCVFVPDASGMGQGVLGLFHQAGKRVFEFHNNGAPHRIEYANKITEAWFELAKRVKASDVYLPKDNRLIQQLSSRQYYTNKKGRLILETKDEYMKRGFDSPDRADATVLAFWDHVEATTRIATRRAA